MSSQVNTYVMQGVLLRYKDLKDRYDDLEPYMDSAFEGIEHHNGLCVLFDGMNGDYVAIGEVLAKTENGQHFNSPVVSDGLTRGDLEMKIERLIGDWRSQTVRTIVVSHYR